MIQQCHEDGWSGDTLYHNWDEFEATDSDTEDFFGGGLTKGKGSIVSVCVHDYIIQAAAEYELSRKWLANNNHVSIYCQFRDHLDLLREENHHPHHPLQFPDGNDEDSDSVHH